MTETVTLNVGCENIFNDENAQRPPQFPERRRKWEKNKTRVGKGKKRKKISSTRTTLTCTGPTFLGPPSPGPHPPRPLPLFARITPHSDHLHLDRSHPKMTRRSRCRHSVDNTFFGAHNQTATPGLILREHMCRCTEALVVQNKGGRYVWVVQSVADMV